MMLFLFICLALKMHEKEKRKKNAAGVLQNSAVISAESLLSTNDDLFNEFGTEIRIWAPGNGRILSY